MSNLSCNGLYIHAIRDARLIEGLSRQRTKNILYGAVFWKNTYMRLFRVREILGMTGITIHKTSSPARRHGLR